MMGESKESEWMKRERDWSKWTERASKGSLRASERVLSHVTEQHVLAGSVNSLSRSLARSHSAPLLSFHSTQIQEVLSANQDAVFISLCECLTHQHTLSLLSPPSVPLSLSLFCFLNVRIRINFIGHVQVRCSLAASDSIAYNCCSHPSSSDSHHCHRYCHCPPRAGSIVCIQNLQCS